MFCAAAVASSAGGLPIGTGLTMFEPIAASAETIYYQKVTSTDDITNGEYLIVYEDDSLAFNGALESLDLDAVNNYVEVTISEGKIKSNSNTDRAAFTIDVKNKTLKSASGHYIGRSSNNNGLNQSDSYEYTNSLSINETGNAVITSSSGPTLRFNNSGGQMRFRYYKSGQKPITLYKKDSGGSSPASSYTVTVNETVNGTVTAQNLDGDPITTAVAGTVVELDVEPSGGYVLDTLTIKDPNNNDVSLLGDESPSEYAFTMPASNVTVSATFKEAASAPDPTFTVTIPAEVTLGGTPATVSVSDVANIPSGKNLVVTMSGSGENGAFTVTNSDDTLSYTVTKDSSDVAAGGTIISTNAAANAELTFNAPTTEPLYAGEYKGTVTFNVSIS